PKIHPATREVLPDDPMELRGFQVPGDPQLMLRLLVEEYARVGWGIDSIMQLALDPNYEAFHKFLQQMGEEELRQQVGEIIDKCGIIRVKTKEAAPVPQDLVQLNVNPKPTDSSK
ncbi:hypothetical protein, partial [uncultured Gimesia sp.]|uniref:hypothetical protein n=1 Tax=uncultured Gimesia sp. TaxID=1678688 RepID=UPI00260D073F